MCAQLEPTQPLLMACGRLEVVNGEPLRVSANRVTDSKSHQRPAGAHASRRCFPEVEATCPLSGAAEDQCLKLPGSWRKGGLAFSAAMLLQRPGNIRAETFSQSKSIAPHKLPQGLAQSQTGWQTSHSRPKRPVRQIPRIRQLHSVFTGVFSFNRIAAIMVATFLHSITVHGCSQRLDCPAGAASCHRRDGGSSRIIALAGGGGEAAFDFRGVVVRNPKHW